jgi:hypothetical protein
MFDDDGTIPPSLRRAPRDPHWRHLDDAQASNTNPVDNILTEGAALGHRAALTVDVDGPASAVVPVNSEPVELGAQTALYRRATESWDHLKQTQRHNWGQYIVIGEAMVAARAEILRKLNRTEPTGPAYQRAFKAWLVEYGLDDMDKGARARLIKLIEALPEVEEMLSGWSDRDRRERNHPNAIYRALEKRRLAHGQPAEIRTKKPTGNSRKELLQKVECLRAHIADIEAAREFEMAATAINPAEPTDIVIETNPGDENERKKKMTPSVLIAEHVEGKRHQRLEDAVFLICCAYQNIKEIDLTTLTAAERDAAVPKLEAIATGLKEFIGRLKAAPIRTERARQHD